MGKNDRRCSWKMRRRKSQEKLKERGKKRKDATPKEQPAVLVSQPT